MAAHLTKGRILFYISLVLLAEGLFAAYSTHRFMGRAVRTEGRVLPYNYVKHPVEGATYFPVVVFEANGAPVTWKSKKKDLWARREVGSPVAIYYDPKDPSKAIPDSFQFLWGRTAWFLAIWVLCSVLAWASRSRPGEAKEG